MRLVKRAIQLISAISVVHWVVTVGIGLAVTSLAALAGLAPALQLLAGSGVLIVTASAFGCRQRIIWKKAVERAGAPADDEGTRLDLTSPAVAAATDRQATSPQAMTAARSGVTPQDAFIWWPPIQTATTNFIQLGIKPGPPPFASKPVPYVPRAVDAALERACSKHHFVIVLGSPSSGKSRSLHEALKTAGPSSMLIAPRDWRAFQTLPDQALALDRAVPYFVWLEALEEYIGAGLSASFIHTLRGILPNLMLAGTMQTPGLRQLSQDPSTTSARRLAGLLGTAQIIDFPREFSTAERQRAASMDERVPPDLSLPQYLTGMEALRIRYHRAAEEQPLARALVDAAADYRRVGARGSLSDKRLYELATSYLRPANGSTESVAPTADDLQSALWWATKEESPGLRLLVPKAPLKSGSQSPGEGSLPGSASDIATTASKLRYTASDIVVDERLHSAPPVPYAVWKRAVLDSPAASPLLVEDITQTTEMSEVGELIAHRDGISVLEPGLALRVALSSHARGDVARANAAYERALLSSSRLVRAVAKHYRTRTSPSTSPLATNAIPLNSMASLYALAMSAVAALESGEGQRPERIMLLEALVSESEGRAKYNAMFMLALEVRDGGDPDRAQEFFREVVKSGEPALGAEAKASLAKCHAVRGDTSAAIKLYEEVMESGFPNAAARAAYRLATMLQQLGKLDDAGVAYERAMIWGSSRRAAAAGYRYGLMLHQVGDLERAASLLQGVTTCGVPKYEALAAYQLGLLYWGTDSSAETWLTTAIVRGKEAQLWAVVDSATQAKADLQTRHLDIAGDAETCPE